MWEDLARLAECFLCTYHEDKVSLLEDVIVIVAVDQLTCKNDNDISLSKRRKREGTKLLEEEGLTSSATILEEIREVEEIAATIQLSKRNRIGSSDRSSIVLSDRNLQKGSGSRLAN